MSRRSRPTRSLVSLVPLVPLLLAGGVARAQQPAATQVATMEMAAPVSLSPQSWPAPLDRPVVLRLHDVSLRDALDRLAIAARIRLSYSAELLPLDRSVHAAFDSVAAGDALVELLRGTTVGPVVAGRDLVVLAPGRQAVAAAPRAAGPHTLDRVVVTGSAVGASERSLTTALDVIAGTQLTRRDAGTLAQAMDVGAPGLWLWEQSPTSLLARYGSIRGASSFGVSYPKMYIDGIEVANPLLVTRFDAENIERIEVIRGPQGAALYGADAISGVVNILTRHDGVDAGAPRARIRSSAGVSESEFASGPVLAQDHALALRTGTNLRSAGLDVAAGSLGAFYPGATSQHVMATASGRLIGARGSVVGTARFFAEDVGAATNPILADSVPRVGVTGGTGGQMFPPGSPVAARDVSDSTEPQSVREYTVGATMRLASDDVWTHSLVVGVDGYRLGDVSMSSSPFPSSVDSALRAARGGADRATIRASSVARVPLGERATATVTTSLEHSTLRERTESAGDEKESMPGHPHPAGASTVAEDWLHDTGIATQVDAAFHDAFFASGGVRLEQSDAYGFVGGVHYSVLPMLGVASVFDRGGVSVKLRAAFGKGIRPPRTAVRETTMGGFYSRATTASLGPEEQSGIEAGIDLFVGPAFTLQITRYDQRASGLIQRVALPDSAAIGGRYVPRFDFALQNVGAIANRGWEMQGTTRRGPLALTAAVALVDSRVLRLAQGYGGDLYPGARMLDVPAQTLSLSATWTAGGWLGTLTAARAFDWVDYDRVALARDLSGDNRHAHEFTGTQLRGYWRQYDGVTRLRASASRSMARGLSLLLTGDNLLDEQRGEPDNVTVLPGRTITAGLRVSF